MKAKLKHLKYTIFHPFDGFYDTRHRKKGSVWIAAVIAVIYCVLKCIAYQYSGFLINLNALFRMDSVAIAISAISVPMLFIIANWAVTTLFDGKGKPKDIMIVLAYSAVPYLILEAFRIWISNYVITEEVIILNAVVWLGVVWFAFNTFAGLCVVHEYSPSKNIVTLFATLIAGAIIIFLFILFLSLMEQMVSFFTTAGKELFRRM